MVLGDRWHGCYPVISLIIGPHCHPQATSDVLKINSYLLQCDQNHREKLYRTRTLNGNFQGDKYGQKPNNELYLVTKLIFSTKTREKEPFLFLRPSLIGW